MSIYLYQALATETVEDEYTDDVIAWPGATLGRATGYLSRSSAVFAGDRSGIAYVIVRSRPVVFETPLVIVQANEIDDLKEKLTRVSL